ncbi:hypothetical protein [Gallaecimonas mangrovi]|uniref:hypothetical protein n=1 Tax=Gallaecimonas mangrovi TaxID=2291597 RepID=UPI0012603B99|nr:hypothetical protein [Gallaecimonas mangrovi]
MPSFARLACLFVAASLMAGCVTTTMVSTNPQCEAESTNGSLLAGLKWNFRSKDWDHARKARDWDLMVQTLYSSQEKPVVSLARMQQMANQVQALDLASDMKGSMKAFGNVFAAQCELRVAGKKPHLLNDVTQGLLACPLQTSGQKAINCIKGVLLAE